MPDEKEPVVNRDPTGKEIVPVIEDKLEADLRNAEMPLGSFKVLDGTILKDLGVRRAK